MLSIGETQHAEVLHLVRYPDRILLNRDSSTVVARAMCDGTAKTEMHVLHVL
jgi:hypothetical protein